MATLEELQTALVNADKAGDVQAATALATEVKRMRGNVSPQIANDQISQGAKNFAQDMPWYQQAAAGLGRSTYDAARGLGQDVGVVSRKDVAESRKLDAPLMDTAAGFGGNLAGNIGMMLAPGGALKAAGMGARALGAVPAAETLSAAGGAMLAPRSISGAGALGLGMGLAQPSTSTEETLTNAGIGFGASAAVPALVRALQTAKAGVEPFYEGGKAQILGRLLKRTSAPYSDEAAANLRQASTPFVGPPPEGQAARTIMGEIVPGSIPTAAEAANNPGIAALQRTATQTDPTIMNVLANRREANNAARVGSLAELAGTSGERDLTKAALETTAQDLYGKAFKAGPDLAQMSAARKGEITKLLRTPALQDAIITARGFAANEMKGAKNPAGSIEGLHNVKKALDDQISNATGNDQRILIGLRDRFLKTVDTLSPDYEAARNVFREMAQPLNAMDTAQMIADRAVNPATGKMTPAALARALNDKTAQTATGFKKATLENTFNPQQLGQLGNIKDDLGRELFADTAGKGVGSDTMQKLAYSNFINQAGVPNFLQNFAPTQVLGNLGGRAADALYGRANKEMAQRLAQALMSSGDTASLMALSDPQKMAQIAQLLSRGGASAGMMLPSMLNAQKQ